MKRFEIKSDKGVPVFDKTGEIHKIYYYNCWMIIIFEGGFYRICKVIESSTINLENPNHLKRLVDSIDKTKEKALEKHNKYKELTMKKIEKALF